MGSTFPDLPQEHRYEYRMTERFGAGWTHHYIIHTRWGAVDFHVTEYDPGGAMKGLDPSAGLEFHHRQPPDYMADKAPSHDACCVLKAPCWHDGTSLYAHENLLPMWLTRLSEQEVFGWLLSDIDTLRPDAKATAGEGVGP